MLNVIVSCRGRCSRCGYICYGEFAHRVGQLPLYVCNNSLYGSWLCRVHSNNSRLSELVTTTCELLLHSGTMGRCTQHLLVFRTITTVVRIDHNDIVQLRHIKEETLFRVCPFSRKFAYLVYRETLITRYQIGYSHEDCNVMCNVSAKVSGGLHDRLGLVRLVPIYHPVCLKGTEFNIRSPCCRNKTEINSQIAYYAPILNQP